MAALTHFDSIQALRKEYEFTQELRYSNFFYSRSSSWDMTHKGFTGSSKEISLETEESMYLSRGSCLAAPEISIVAVNRIAMGTGLPFSSLKPLRLYVPRSLFLEADAIYVGDVRFLEIPDSIIIISRQMVFCRTGREEPETFEILNNWIDRDRTEVEEVFIS